MDNGEIILFQMQGGEAKIEVRLANESVWLTADQMAELFQHYQPKRRQRLSRIIFSEQMTKARIDFRNNDR